MAAPNDLTALNDIARQAGHAYWKLKDLPAAVALLRDGIDRGQTAAAQNPAAASEILGTVKAMAFNLASFTWPGWDEAGIAVSAEQVALGREAAVLNYRLAIELHRPADKVAVAHWLVGAHALSAADHEQARREFLQCRATAMDDATPFLADGYVAIACLSAGQDATGAFQQAIASLNALDNQDGRFFSRQLETARRVLVRS